MEAAKEGHLECVAVALKHGADIDFATKNANATAAMFENNAQKKLLIVDVANANSPGVLPTVDNLSEEMRERVDLFFKTCDHLDCRPPKRPFPRDVDPCRAPR